MFRHSSVIMMRDGAAPMLSCQARSRAKRSLMTARGPVVRARRHVGVHAQREGRIAVAKVLGELLDRDASGKHHAGVVMTELVNAFPASGEVAAAAAPVDSGLSDQVRKMVIVPDG